jgi:hypothetical protein
LTSSTSVVVVAGPAASTPQGAHHRHHQHQWWPLQDLPPAPQGSRHRCLQLRWWPLPEIPIATPRVVAIDVFNIGGSHCRTSRQQPPGRPPSTSSTSVVATAGPAGSTPRGPTINVSIFSGGRCLTCRKHPQGACRRRLQHRWWLLVEIPTAAVTSPRLNRINSILIPLSCNFFFGSPSAKNSRVKRAEPWSNLMMGDRPGSIPGCAK